MNTVTISPNWIDDDNDEDYDPSRCRSRKRKPRGKYSLQCKKQAKIHPSDVMTDVNEDESADSITLLTSSQMAFTSIEANEHTLRQTAGDPAGSDMPDPSGIEQNTVNTELSYGPFEYSPTTQQPIEAFSDFSYPVTTHGETEPRCHSTFDRCQDIPEKQHCRDNISTEE